MRKDNKEVQNKKVELNTVVIGTFNAAGSKLGDSDMSLIPNLVVSLFEGNPNDGKLLGSSTVKVLKEASLAPYEKLLIMDNSDISKDLQIVYKKAIATLDGLSKGTGFSKMANITSLQIDNLYEFELNNHLLNEVKRFIFKVLDIPFIYVDLKGKSKEQVNIYKSNDFKRLAETSLFYARAFDYDPNYAYATEDYGQAFTFES